jgi:DNA-binding IclR family transcriptional regulator
VPVIALRERIGMAGNSAAPGVTVASRLLAILDAFDGEHRSLSLSDLASRADLSLPTAHRLVRELVGWGALVRSTSGEYVIGQRMWTLGLLAPLPVELGQLASPFLHDIHGATLSTVHLVVRDGAAAVCVDRVAGRTSVRLAAHVGSRMPLHATGAGKVLLAYAPVEVQKWVFANLTRITPYTVTQPGRLHEEIHRVHREGYAQTVEEMTMGACSLAVPIFSPDERVVAAIAVVLPTTFTQSRPRLVEVLQEAARGVGGNLSRRHRRLKKPAHPVKHGLQRTQDSPM